MNLPTDDLVLALVDPTAENVPLDTVVEEIADAVSSGNVLAVLMAVALIGITVGRVLLRRRSRPKLVAPPKPEGVAAVVEVKPASRADDPEQP